MAWPPTTPVSHVRAWLESQMPLLWTSANVPGKAAEDVSSAWASINHMDTQQELLDPDFCLVKAQLSQPFRD